MFTLNEGLQAFKEIFVKNTFHCFEFTNVMSALLLTLVQPPEYAPAYVLSFVSCAKLSGCDIELITCYTLKSPNYPPQVVHHWL